MKSGKEYKITTKFTIDELIDKIMPKNINEFRFSNFSLAGNEKILLEYQEMKYQVLSLLLRQISKIMLNNQNCNDFGY